MISSWCLKVSGPSFQLHPALRLHPQLYHQHLATSVKTPETRLMPLEQNNGVYSTYENPSGPGSNQVRCSCNGSCMRALTRTDSGIKQPRLSCVLCDESFLRPRELYRHIQSLHLPYCLYCPYSGCRWRGARKDQFQKHQKNNHRSGELPAYQIYDAKMVLDWIKTAESVDFIPVAQTWAVGLVQEKATELRRDQWLDDPWGYQ
jgi:hypothetical protein